MTCFGILIMSLLVSPVITAILFLFNDRGECGVILKRHLPLCWGVAALLCLGRACLGI